MTDLKKKAQEVAKAGRFGDTTLIHVAPEELKGLASLMPNGKLTVNPTTGLPEAFFFLPFLAGLGAAAAPAAAAAVPAAATGALGAGMAAGAGAAATGLAGLGAAAAPAAAGLTGAGLAGTSAGLAANAAAPALAGAGAAGATGSALGAAMPSVVGGSTAAASLPVAGASGLPSVLGSTPLAGTGALGSAGAAAPITASTASGGAAGMAGPTIAAANALPAAATTGAGAAGGSTAGGLGSLFGSMDAGKMLQYGALASMMMPQGGGGGGDDGGGGKKGKRYSRGDAAENTGSVTDSEFDYFPDSHYYKKGGLVKGDSHSAYYFNDGGVQVLRSGMSDEDRDRASRNASKALQKKKGYAEGGLASLAPQEPEANDEQLIDMTVAALQGQAPNADAIIQQFIQVFGPDALRDLIQQVQGGAPQGDGMSDSVPAVVNGQNGQSEPAALSEGEFVVPADVVSGLGNGSTEAGAQQLEGMMQRTRQMRTGGVVQPPAMNPRSVMPI